MNNNLTYSPAIRNAYIETLCGISENNFSWKIMTMTKKKINYKVFIPGGTALIGLGVVFMAAVNLAMGIVFIAAGISLLAIGIVNRSKE